MKKIIFFDGDGTLWYPKTTKYKKEPHWIYFNSKTSKTPNKHLMLIPTVLFTLRKLKKQKIILIVLSTHPHSPKQADTLIKGKIKHFNLDNLFDEVHATKTYYKSKGEIMLKILKRRNISKNKALMVGDQYLWDYKPAKENGIDAVLIKSEYMKNFHNRKGIKTIKKLKDLFNIINNS